MPLRDEALADEFRVEPSHDAQERRLARTVDAERADLRIRVEGEVDVLQHLLAARPSLGQALHVIDELARGHTKFLGFVGRKLAAGNIRRGDRKQGEAMRRIGSAGRLMSIWLGLAFVLSRALPHARRPNRP